MTRRRLRTANMWAVISLFVLGLAESGGARDSSASLAAASAGAIRAEVMAGVEANSGGETSVFDESPTAFGRALANLQPFRWQDVLAGKERFRREWPQRGPWADASSCASCHAHDGRGPQPGRGHDGLSHLLRLGQTSVEGDPVYGVQLRRFGYGVPAPGQFAVQWQEIRGRYLSGETYTLRRPIAHVRELAYGPLDPRTRLSLRVPPAVFGLGLLEAVSDGDILSLADPDDADKDGISGRARWVRDPATGRMTLGRFGWKAAQPSLAAQSGAALAVDMGVTNPVAPARPPGSPRKNAFSGSVYSVRSVVDFRLTQTTTLPFGRASRSMTHGSTPADEPGPEVAEAEVNALVQYLRALAVPGRRRGAEPVVRRGQALFSEIGCRACHRLQFTTAHLAGWPELSRQTISPYSDLLLHDLGAALADEVVEGSASGSEWRTAPLWGLGLLPVVSSGARLLHDGRARSSEEAILWHGGEAEAARVKFSHLPLAERQALLTFLSTL